VVDLLFWFLVSQTIAGLPDMHPGTEVRIVSVDLLTVHASAQVQDNQLVLQGDLGADSEVRVLILQADASAQEAVDALGSKALFAHISPSGNDILVQFEEIDGPLSFKKWLKEERGITFKMPKKAGE